MTRKNIHAPDNGGGNETPTPAHGDSPRREAEVPAVTCGAPEDSEAVFAMDPVAVLLALSRQLLHGQQTLAHHARTLADLTPAERQLPQLQKLLADDDRLTASWNDDILPTILASMKVALEVYDTFGPGRTQIDDAFEARLWNNKVFAAVSMLRTPR